MGPWPGPSGWPALDCPPHARPPLSPSAHHRPPTTPIIPSQVSAFVTASRLRLLLLHDGRPDDAVRAFFRDAHEALLKAVLNPFFSPSARIASPAFDRKVRALARVHFRQ